MINLWNFYEKKALEKLYLNVLKSQIFENLHFEPSLIPSNTYSHWSTFCDIGMTCHRSCILPLLPPRGFFGVNLPTVQKFQFKCRNLTILRARITCHLTLSSHFPFTNILKKNCYIYMLSS